MSFQDALTDFIQSNIVPDGAPPVSPDESLLDRDLMDSMALMQVLTFIENHAGVRVPDGRVTPDAFDSVESITRLVADLKG